ncbi:MAG TPA: hypothetical protein VJ827_05370 [Rubrobacter sp.]|nr:hypothetical protein [Rubrobacter sp.]
MRAALAHVGALAGFLVGLWIFGVAPDLCLPGGILAVGGCWGAVWIMAKASGTPGEDEG